MTAKQREVIPIIFAIDDNYAPVLHVTIRSIIAHANPDYQYQFHIMYENLADTWQQSLQTLATANCQIEFNYIGDAIKQYAQTMHYKYYGSNAIYYRVFIPELFPQYDKVIYLDADVVLNADISELYHYDLGDNYIGGVLCEIVNGIPVFIDYAKKFLGLGLEKPCYFNSGVLVMNCAKLREVDFIKQFFEIANSFKLEICPDQDYYNLLCYGKTVLFPGVWNKMPIPGSKQKLDELKLVHFNVAGKPWKQQNALYGELFWQHAQDTPVYAQLRQMQAAAAGQNFGADKVRLLAGLAKELASKEENLLQVIQKRQGAWRIPKKIHYIWLGGGTFTLKIKACMASWRKYCPDFEIIEWNENNFDLDKCPLIKKALAKKNYSLASDMMRVHILNEHGGIYLDTDVEILKPLDRFMQHELFLGYESKYWVCTAVVGGVPGHPVFQTLAALCASPLSLKIGNWLSLHMWSAVLAQKYKIKANGKTRLLDNGVGVYSKEWFYPIHYLTKKKVMRPNTHTIHYYDDNMWGNEREVRAFNGFVKTFAWYFNAPIYHAAEYLAARICRRRVNRLFKKLVRLPQSK